MSEQQKENAPLNQKEKTLLLEEDIGKEFLTSWKSMSVAGDDPMDFNFDTVGKNKKAFKFDKLDMDFSLDSADFDDLPSFNVDLPELDLSSSSKKCHQDKEKTEEESSNNRGRKKDSFSFSFDYNELDAFDFGASMKNREGMVHKGRDDQVASPLTVESHCFKTNRTKAPISIGMDASSNKLFPSKTLTAEMDMKVSLRVPNSSRTANPVQTSRASSSPILEKEVGTSTERIATFNAKEDEKGQFLEKSVSEATFCLPSTEDDSNFSGREEVISSDASSAQVSGPDKKDVRDTGFIKDKKDGTDKGKAEVHIQDFTPYSLSNVQHHSTYRGPELEKVVPESKYNDSRDVGSKFHKKPGAIVPQSRLDSLLGEKHGDIISKGLSTRSINLADETRSGRNDDVLLSGRKLVSSLGLPSKELTKSQNEELAIQKFCEKSKKVGMTSSTVMASMSSPTSRDHPDTICSSIDMPSKSSLTTCLLPNMTRTVGSTLTSRFDKADGAKVGSIKGPKNNCGLSSLRMRNLRTLRMKEDQLSSTAFKENLTIANAEQKTDKNNSEPEVARGASLQKTPLVNLSLKRKNLEVANDIPSFHPLKRLLESPKENRSFKVPSDRVLMKEVNDTEIHNTYASTQNETIQVTDSYQENQQKVLLMDNAAGAEFSWTCEANSNVSKAEAYAKELEDMCDLLRKKQEEAKELLVRALVNNNNLLMLNRPIYDEKIRAVQKFAAQLMSKQLVI